MTGGDHGGDEEHAADAFTAADDQALAAPLAGLAGPGRETGERCDLAAIERTEFREFGDQAAGDDLAHAGYRGEQVLLFRPDRRAADMIIDITVDFGEFLLERLAQPNNALSQALVGDAPFALAFGCHHLHDLAPSGHQIGQELCHLVGQRARLRIGRLDKMSDHGGVDWIGLGAFAECLSEGSNLRRVDDHDRQRRRRPGRPPPPFRNPR